MEQGKQQLPSQLCNITLIWVQNVLIGEGGVLKIADLGISQMLTHVFTRVLMGTPNYMTPEMFRHQPFSYSADIWALGCILHEMCSLRPLFLGRTEEQIREKVLSGKLLPIPSKYSQSLWDLITQLLQPNPADRPTIDEILAMPEVRERAFMLPRVDWPYMDPAHQSQAEVLGLIRVSTLGGQWDNLNERLPPARYLSGCGVAESLSIRRPSSCSDLAGLEEQQLTQASSQQQQQQPNSQASTGLAPGAAAGPPAGLFRFSTCCPWEEGWAVAERLRRKSSAGPLMLSRLPGFEEDEDNEEGGSSCGGEEKEGEQPQLQPDFEAAAAAAAAAVEAAAAAVGVGGLTAGQEASAVQEASAGQEALAAQLAAAAAADAAGLAASSGRTSSRPTLRRVKSEGDLGRGGAATAAATLASSTPWAREGSALDPKTPLRLGASDRFNSCRSIIFYPLRYSSTLASTRRSAGAASSASSSREGTAHGGTLWRNASGLLTTRGSTGRVEEGVQWGTHVGGALTPRGVLPSSYAPDSTDTTAHGGPDAAASLAGSGSKGKTGLKKLKSKLKALFQEQQQQQRKERWDAAGGGRLYRTYWYD